MPITMCDKNLNIPTRCYNEAAKHVLENSLIGKNEKSRAVKTQI